MISRCPHCQLHIQFSQPQTEKLNQALAALEPGKLLAMKCPHCQQTIKLDKSGMSEQENLALEPPPPPSLDWLKAGKFQAEEKVEDVPMALLLHKPSVQRDQIQKSIEEVGYQVVTAESVSDAIQRMRFVNFASVIFHSPFETSLDQSTFHTYMREMAMERRRYIFYILIGPDLRTLYDLEALACSANLVINEADLQYLNILLRKAIPEYEELFGPILEELSAYGRR